jgi:hypothetical protein
VVGDAIPFELQMEAGAPYVVVRMEMNSEFVRLLLDTGSDGITLFAARMQERMPFFEKTVAGKDINAGGEYAVDRIRISDARLGGIARSKLKAAMISSTASALRDFDGLLGPASLGITRIALDFFHRTCTSKGTESCLPLRKNSRQNLSRGAYTCGAIFRIGAWLIQPQLHTIARDAQVTHVEPKAMQVLVYLAEHADQVVPKERLGDNE